MAELKGLSNFGLLMLGMPHCEGDDEYEAVLLPDLKEMG